MPDSPRRPNVLTIPAGVAFLPALARGLLDGEIVPGFAPRGDPIALARATVYLPTRRAARALRDAFLAELDGRATLLPRIAPLGDVDEDLALSEPLDEADAELPPAAPPLTRRLTLARLVSRLGDTLERAILQLGPEHGPLIPSTAADAIHLAGELEALIDAIETEEVEVSRLDTLVPGEHDQYWAITQNFLRVALRAWPDHVGANGLLDPSRRRRFQLDAAARRAAGGDGPVIAAGSTGSAPATRRLIAAIADHPLGAVVLPGFDVDGLDDAAWATLLEDDGAGLYGHPQRGLARLVKELGLSRGAVRTLTQAPAPLESRARLTADALRPADTTDAWSARRKAAETEAALHGLSLIEAPHPRAEAAAIAVVLREAIAEPGRTAALVTPDRDLAARVAAELERWEIAIDDSAGRALAATPAGALLKLASETALDPSPASILTLLRAPACRLASGLSRGLDALDVAILRAPLPGAGLDGVLRALVEQDRPRGPAKRFGAADLAEALDLVGRLRTVLGPLMTLASEGAAPLPALVAALAHAYSAMSEGSESEDAIALSLFLEELEDAAPAADPIAPAAFPGVMEALMAGRVVRPPRDRHPRLAILGPLEARLIRFDRVVLGGLNETVWPPVPQADPWINRPLRAQLGLAPPERRIGLSAHDFCQALGAEEVVLTRAKKAGGAPTIPSRWLQRLAAVAAGPAFEAAKARGARYVTLAESLYETDREPTPRPPEPRPPLEARPSRISVTAVETWLRDPYSIYARHILKLDELAEIGPEPGPAELGNAIHRALEDFAKAGLSPDDPSAREKLIDFGKAAFGALLQRDDARTLWWPRFVAIADWTLAFHAGRKVAAFHVEQEGRVVFTTAAGRDFTLNARADRIEALPDGSFAFLDYKTGRTPGVKEILAGFAPQLALEGGILRSGGFAGVADNGAVVGELVLVRLVGRDPAGEVIDVRGKSETPDEVAEKAIVRFKAVVDRFEDEATPYLSLSHPKFLSRPEGPYAHLARVKEWSSTGGADEGDAE
ncbi:double-strand break repair protein AddB [Hansschlegelia quercus]|uniref:Double-strand break repair protein AddB n=1 Tax=Hansschlegelia quercus TaxID=2528245 RepID=A0A4Q9GGY5_9HYPH|nr:double-strand break repair protein AddB [Hansschlegelia quercus]TBN53272.1 double-strand break repair protein AddB [Hansschlegelia quercus]